MNLLTPSDFNSPLTITELTSPNKKVLVIEDKQLLLNRQNINMKFNYYLIFEFDTKKFYFCDIKLFRIGIFEVSVNVRSKFKSLSIN